MASCIFCSLRTDLIFLQSHNFNIIYDPYPILPGHLLIVSKTHYGCVGELPENLVNEFSQLKIFASELITSLYGCVFCFEHGKSGACNHNDMECNHLHFHILPFSGNIEEQINITRYDIANIHELLDYYNSYGEYLFLENSQQNKYFYSSRTKKILNHYIRTLIAENINKPERSDWLSYNEDNILFKETKRALQLHEVKIA